jgi:hypothetical protein
VSCASAGNCSAGGWYGTFDGVATAFVVDQKNGTWSTFQTLPGIVALNTGGEAFVTSLSCASAGNCSAGGYYTDSSGHTQAFVVNETHGVWGTTKEIRGFAVLNKGGRTFGISLSCPSAGNCSAGGSYTDSSGHRQVFVVNETHGIWGTAKEVPGTAALNTGGNAGITSVSCASAGNCSAGGDYADRRGHFQAFVVNQTNGTWGKAEEVPGTAALNRGGSAGLGSVSCPAAGKCSAGGTYKDSSGNFQAFVVNRS